MLPPTGAGKGCRGFDTGQHFWQRGLMKGASWQRSLLPQPRDALIDPHRGFREASQSKSAAVAAPTSQIVHQEQRTTTPIVQAEPDERLPLLNE